MKNKIIVTLLSTGLIFSSCKKEEEDNIEEKTTETTIPVDVRDKFIGNFSINYNYQNPNSGQNDNFTRLTAISKISDDEIQLSNVGYGSTYNATVSGNSFVIYSQNPNNEPGNTSGSGTINGDTLNITVYPYEGTLSGSGIKQ